MNESAAIPFAERLNTLLKGLNPERTQVWLATESGVSAATVSRLLAGKRLPDMATVEALAPVLGLDPAQLVAGTEVADRLALTNEFVRRREHDAALARARELENSFATLNLDRKRVKRLLDVEQKRRVEAETAFVKGELELRDLRLETDMLRGEKQTLLDEGAKLRHALDIAAEKIGALSAAVERLEHEVQAQGRTSAVTKILAGIGAAAGVVTAATLLASVGGGQQDEDEEEQHDDQR